MQRGMKSGIKKVLRALAWAIGAPVLLIGGVILVVVAGGVAAAIVEGPAGPDRDAEAEREFARYKAEIAARGGYIIMHAGSAVYHLPVYGGTCSGGRDHRNYRLNLDLPALTVSREDCEAPFVRADRALIFFSEYSPPFLALPSRKTGWSPPPVRAGEQHFEQCSVAAAQADTVNRCGRLTGVSAGGIHYDGHCSSVMFCSLRTRVAGLDADFHLYPAQRTLVGPLVDRLDNMIRATAVKPQPPA